MNITELLRAHAVGRPEAVAIVDTRNGRKRSTSYAGLELASARVAALLRKQRLRPGHAVLVFLPMSAELYVSPLSLSAARSWSPWLWTRLQAETISTRSARSMRPRP